MPPVSNDNCLQSNQQEANVKWMTAKTAQTAKWRQIYLLGPRLTDTRCWERKSEIRGTMNGTGICWLRMNYQLLDTLVALHCTTVSFYAHVLEEITKYKEQGCLGTCVISTAYAQTCCIDLYDLHWLAWAAWVAFGCIWYHHRNLEWHCGDTVH